MWGAGCKARANKTQVKKKKQKKKWTEGGRREVEEEGLNRGLIYLIRVSG